MRATGVHESIIQLSNPDMQGHTCDSKLSITNVIRRMRGRSGAHLVQANNGRYYVAKFKGNPKGTRTLVNELLGSLILRWLGHPVAEGVILNLDESNLPKADWPFVGNPNDKCRAEPELHFGSAFPGNPNTDVVHDLFPMKASHLITNLAIVDHVLFVDIWLGRSEPRQAVFSRNQDRKFTGTLIDNSMLFGGSDWNFNAKAEQARFFDRSMYDHTNTFSPSQKLLMEVAKLFNTRRSEFLQQIPAEWLMGDEVALPALLDELGERAKRLVPDQYRGGLQSDADIAQAMVSKKPPQSALPQEKKARLQSGG